MIIYIFKTIACSAILLFFYLLFLETEKMHRFNRFYLLLCIAFSFIAPIIKIKTESHLIPVLMSTYLIPENSLQTNVFHQQPIPLKESNLLPNLMALFYLSVTVFFLFRYFKNMFIIFTTIKKNKVIPYLNSKLVLINNNVVPHSFLNYIFINKEKFETGITEKEILSHELAHIRQKHTFDILFIELLLAFVWFNPFLFLYRKAIKLNHEFLADDAVIKTIKDISIYQYILLAKVNLPKSLSPTSQFNYLTTKKRMIMMSKKTSTGIAVLKQIALTPVLAGIISLFSTKTIAQDSVKVEKLEQKQKVEYPSSWLGKTVGSTKEGISEALLKEYGEIVAKHRTTGKDWWQEFRKENSEADKNRLEALYKQMTIQQQNEQIVDFIAPIGPLPRVVPTKAQLESWKNAQIYGVWLNEKKIRNEELKKYQNTDIAQVSVSKLYGAAKKNVSYNYQVDLMTNEFYQNYYDQTVANKGNIMVFRRIKKVITK